MAMSPKQKIANLKAKLKSGDLSQEQAEQVRQKIIANGGKVNLTNFGYGVSSQNAGQGPTSQDVVNATDDIGRNDPGGAMDAEIKAEDFNANKTITNNNATTSNPFGGSEVTFDANGNPVYTETLSENQGKILEGQENLTQTGLNNANNLMNNGTVGGPFDPTLAQRAMDDDLISERQRIEDEIYGKLSKNLERDRGRELESAEQTLFNKGIPFSADPESRYQKELSVIQDRYDSRDESARSQATMQGGDEFLKQFGAQEQLIANQLAEQTGIHNTNWNNVFNNQGMGSGFIMPNLPGYAGPGGYNPYSPMDIWGAVQGNNQGWEQLKIANAAANKPPSGGGAPPPAQPSGPPIVSQPGL